MARGKGTSSSLPEDEQLDACDAALKISGGVTLSITRVLSGEGSFSQNCATLHLKIRPFAVSGKENVEFSINSPTGTPSSDELGLLWTKIFSSAHG